MNTPITINNINTTPNICTGTDIILTTVIRYNRRPIVNQKKHCTTRLHILNISGRDYIILIKYLKIISEAFLLCIILKSM